MTYFITVSLSIQSRQDGNKVKFESNLYCMNKADNLLPPRWLCFYCIVFWPALRFSLWESGPKTVVRSCERIWVYLYCLSLEPCSNRRHSLLLTIKWDGFYYNIFPSGPRVFLFYLNIDIHSTQPLHHVALCDKMYVSLNCTEMVLTEAAVEGKTNCLNPFIHTTVFKFYRVLCPFWCAPHYSPSSSEDSSASSNHWMNFWSCWRKTCVRKGRWGGEDFFFQYLHFVSDNFFM